MWLNLSRVSVERQRSGKRGCLDLSRGCWVKRQRGAESPEELQECSEHWDNGLILMNGGCEEVTLLMREPRKQKSKQKSSVWQQTEVMSTHRLLLKKTGWLVISDIKWTRHRYYHVMWLEIMLKVTHTVSVFPSIWSTWNSKCVWSVWGVWGVKVGVWIKAET